MIKIAGHYYRPVESNTLAMKKKGITKRINLGEVSGTDIDNKLSLAKCRDMLNDKVSGYTDEQVLQIRDWLYEFAAMTYDEYFNRKTCMIIPLTNNQNTHDEESHYLCAG